MNIRSLSLGGLPAACADSPEAALDLLRLIREATKEE